MITYDTWVQAQQAVLGDCLIEERVASKIVFGVVPEDFCPELRTIYLAIRDLYTRQKPIDPITIMGEIGQEYLQTIKQLIEITPTAANIDAHIDVLKRQSRVLQLREVGRALTEINDEAAGDEILQNAARPEVLHDDRTWSLAECLTDFMSRYRQKPDYLGWFIPQLRRMIRALPGNVFVLGGRPSSGKSAFADQAALYWAYACRKRVGYFSNETSRQELTERLASIMAGIPLDKIQERTLSNAEWQRFADAAARIAEAPLYICESADCTAAQIREKALHEHYDIVIIDYLQIVNDPGKTEYDRVTNVSRQMQRMAKKHGIFCLELCQLSRVHDGERPTLADIRSSGQIEQDADIVAFLHPLKKEPDVPREFIVSKNKNGTLGVTRLAFNGSYQQFAYLGKGQKALAPFDYAKARYYGADPVPDPYPQESYALLDSPDPNNPFGKEAG